MERFKRISKETRLIYEYDKSKKQFVKVNDFIENASKKPASPPKPEFSIASFYI